MASGSQKLDQIVERLKSTTDPKRRYEYVLWLAKKRTTATRPGTTEGEQPRN